MTRQKRKLYNEISHVPAGARRAGLHTCRGALVGVSGSPDGDGGHARWSSKCREGGARTPLGRARAAQDLADLAPIDQTLEKEHHERTKVKNIQVIELGRYEVRRALS